MLAHWFDRGLGQILAPDEKHAASHPPDEEPETLGSFWQIVAPDPTFDEAGDDGTKPKPQQQKVPPSAAFSSPLPSSATENNNQVECVHCHRLTPAKKAGLASTLMTTPSPSNETTTPTQLDGLVLEAAKETAASMTSPPTVTEMRNKVFRLCASSKPLSDKLCQRLRRLIQQDPSLIKTRSAHLGNLVPDGYTPLIAAAAVNNLAAVQILLEEYPSAWHDRDLQGRTALHVAAELGHVDVTTFLQHYSSKTIGPDAPVDLTGHTPLGRAVTSNHAAARKHQEELQTVLFSPGDVSVFGHVTPAKDRCGVSTGGAGEQLSLAYGLADMPGFRVAMEDAICCEFWSDTNAPRALLGVCDGHGDAGFTSAFIAEHAATVLQQTAKEYTHAGEEEEDWSQIWNKIWKTACLRLDESLKQSKANHGGGTTAVLALITTHAIVVANVGDSRCILIQSNKTDTTTASLEESMKDLKLTEEAQPSTEQETAKKTSEEAPDTKETSETTSEEAPAAEETSEKASKEAPEAEDTPKTDNAAQSEDDTGKDPQGSEFVVTAMSEDHKPNLEAEWDRIEKAGLNVVAETFHEDDEEVTIWKVQLSDTEKMAVARSFGDYEYKANSALSAEEQAVVAMPDVKVHMRDADRDMYLVLACDGVWDVMENDEVGEFVATQVEEAQKNNSELGNDAILPHVGDLLLNECLTRGSRDNMSVVVVALSEAADKLGGGGLAGGAVLGGRALDFGQE